MSSCTSNRRDFLAQLSAFGLALAGVPRIPLWRRPRFLANPFALGVASGDPSSSGVVLWTRLAPDPVNGGGMPGDAVNVRWEIAADEAMTKIVQRGIATARPDLAHSVHAEVDGLRPGRWYWYRFDVGGDASPIGRTRTAPAIGAGDRLRFAFASCQHYESGLYTAYHHMSQEDLDFVAHLGDYIYEYNIAEAPAMPVARRHLLAPATTLELYRNRYGRYKADENLQAAHKHFPWIVTWDDHEVENNYANAISVDTTVAPATFLLRRAAAYQAYYEHQPLRKAAIPRGPDALLYRTLDFGSLARLHVLDTRQYRSDQSCGDGAKVPCHEWSDTSRTMMGAMQERWLTRQVDRSAAAWNVIAQQISFSEIFNPQRPELVYMDGWSGYPVARKRLAAYMSTRRERDFVVLTGDIHANFVMDVKADLRDANGPTVAAEFIGTSISSAGDGRDRWPQLMSYETDMPMMQYHSARRGYVTCDVSQNAFTSQYREVPFVTRPGAPVATAASFVVRRGRPGAVKL
jgi:alkaline phosphatase D